MERQRQLCALIITLLYVTESNSQRYTLCTTPQNLNACEQLNRSEDIKCVLRKNAVNCLLMVENGEASITSVTAEEVFLASSLTSNLIVLGEFTALANDRFSINQGEAAEFETVILMKDTSSIKGTRFCHPGIDINQMSPFILKEFEMQTLSQNNVDVCSGENSKSLAEYYIKSLNEFFGSSCRPGRWTIVNTTIDLELRQRYPQLLDLCQTSAYQENQQYPFFQSLNCLLNGDGDVALTTLNTIKSYNLTQPDFLNNYSFVCKNGSQINATTGSCSWTRQPWSLLVGNKDVSTDLPIYLRNWFVMQPLEGSSDLQLSEKYVQSFKQVIFPDQLQYTINITYDMPNLETYVPAFRDRPTTENSRLCKSSVIMCVVSAEEEKKCKWLQQAALNYGVQPVIDCVTKTSKLECLKAIRNTMADVTVVNSNMTYIVNRQNLSIIAFAEEKKEDMIRTVLVVNTTTVKSLEDLQGKSGFFSEYGDIAWLAFADILRQKLWTNPEYYGQELTNFLGNSCMPGIQDLDREPYPIGINADKLCSLCGNDPTVPTGSENCNTDSSNICYGSDGALKCLSLTGDFAVIILPANLKLPNNTAIMCKNGTLASSSNIDDDCALSVTVNDQIITRKSDLKNKNIEMMLQELDERFAAQTHTSFKIFDTFGNIKDLIFKETTIGMEIASISNNRYARRHLELFENIPKPRTSGNIDNSGGGDSGSFIVASFALMCSSLFVLWINSS